MRVGVRISRHFCHSDQFCHFCHFALPNTSSIIRSAIPSVPAISDISDNSAILAILAFSSFLRRPAPQKDLKTSRTSTSRPILNECAIRKSGTHVDTSFTAGFSSAATRAVFDLDRGSCCDRDHVLISLHIKSRYVQLVTYASRIDALHCVALRAKL